MDRDKERLIEQFAEEVWDAVCRLRVGSGLTAKEVRRALNQVVVLVDLEAKTMEEEEEVEV